MKIKSLTFDGFHFENPKTYNFKDMNYLYGHNGAGKSTVLECIQLCILGYIPGTSKNVGEIFAHSCKRHMDIELVLDDDGNEITISRYFTAKGDSATSTVEINPTTFDMKSIISEIELPIFDFNNFLNLTANKMKDWFLSFLPKQVADFSWENVLATGTNRDIPETLLNQTIARLTPLEKTIDGVKQANQFFKDRISLEKQSMQTLQSTISSLVKYDDIAEDLNEEEIKMKIAEINTTVMTQTSIQTSIKHNEQINAELATIHLNAENAGEDKDYIDCQNKIADIEFERSKLLEHSDTLNSQIESVRGEIGKYQQLISKGDGTCPYTNKPCEEVKAVINEATVELEKLKDVLDNYKKQSLSISEQLSHISNQLDALKLEKSKIIANYDKAKALANQLVAIPENYVEADISFLESQKAEYVDALGKIAANKKYDEMIDKLTSDVAVFESNILIYKDWEKATSVNGLQTLLATTASPFTILEDEMNNAIKQIFGENCSANFNLSTKANSFSFGLNRDDKYIKYDLLSSGEKCIYMIALLTSILRISDTKLKLLLVDDAFDHLDDVNVEKLFEMMKTFNDVQMIFAGVKEVENCEEYIVRI